MSPLPIAWLFCLCATAALAADAPPRRCTDEAHRQFDFWIGHWDVSAPSGKPLGENRITAAPDGCSLYEAWQGRGGVIGHSLNRYDPAAGRWRQRWIDNRGGQLDLSGGRQGAAMVLEGLDGEGGAPKRQRITWTPQPDGSVRQLWETSDDDGRSWQTAFDGRYVRRKR